MKKKIALRSFVAVEISSEKIIKLISKFQSEININAKPIDPHKLHFTLQFLGETTQENVDRAIKSLNSIKFAGFMVNLKGLGVFPNLKFPKVLWIGTDKIGASLLKELAKKVENALIPIGFSVDKSFKPHITVFRIKNKIENFGEELNKFESVDFGNQEITGFKLKQSVLSSKGSVYSDLLEVKAKI